VRRPENSRGQLAGTTRSPFTASATASGTEISSMGTGRKSPASSSGSPGISHARISTAGRTVSLAKRTPATSADCARDSPVADRTGAARGAADGGPPSAVGRRHRRAGAVSARPTRSAIAVKPRRPPMAASFSAGWAAFGDCAALADWAGPADCAALGDCVGPIAGSCSAGCPPPLCAASACLGTEALTAGATSSAGLS